MNLAIFRAGLECCSLDVPKCSSFQQQAFGRLFHLLLKVGLIGWCLVRSAYVLRSLPRLKLHLLAFERVYASMSLRLARFVSKKFPARQKTQAILFFLKGKPADSRQTTTAVIFATAIMGIVNCYHSHFLLSTLIFNSCS